VSTSAVTPSFELDLLGSHAGRIERILPLGDRAVAVASHDGGVALWSLDGAAPRSLAHFEKDQALCLAYDRAHRAELLVGTYRGLYAVPLAGGKPRRILDGAARDCAVAAIDARNGTIAVALHDECGGADHPILLLDREGEERWVDLSYKWPYGILFSPDGSEVVVHTWDGYLLRFNARTGKLRDRYDDFIGGPAYAATWLSPTELLSADLDGELGVHDVPARKQRRSSKHAGGLHAVSVSPDGTWTAIAGNRGELELLDRSGVVVGSLDLKAHLGQQPDTNAEFPTLAPYYQVTASAVTALAFASPSLLVAGFQHGGVARIALRW
jgi:WD40 repeat protein